MRCQGATEGRALAVKEEGKRQVNADARFPILSSLMSHIDSPRVAWSAAGLELIGSECLGEAFYAIAHLLCK